MRIGDNGWDMYKKNVLIDIWNTNQWPYANFGKVVHETFFIIFKIICRDMKSV